MVNIGQDIIKKEFRIKKIIDCCGRDEDEDKKGFVLRDVAGRSVVVATGAAAKNFVA